MWQQCWAMLLCRYDTVHGKFNGKVEASDKGLIVEGHTIVFHQCKNPGGVSPTVGVGVLQGLVVAPLPLHLGLGHCW